MQVLDYDFQVNKPQAYEEMVPETKAEPEEVEMARKLIEASAAKKFDLAAYPDMYTKRLTDLVEAKVAGKEIVAPPAAEHAQVLNLMDALKQSVAQLGTTPGGAPWIPFVIRARVRTIEESYLRAIL
jgi:DNA end-binding protein Ku